MSRWYPKKVVAKAEDVGIQAPEEKRNSPIKYILEQQKLRTKQDLLKLRWAIDSAENTINPNRELWHAICREIIKDPDLASNWESRRMKVKEKPFKIVSIADEESENDELTDLFENALWFFSWIDNALDSKMWGFTLMEFGPFDSATGNFMPWRLNGKMREPVTVIDRDNVKPELGIITSTPGQIEGIPFEDPRFSRDLMLVCENFSSRGILDKAAKYILFKDNAFGNWSEWAEVFGMDKRVGYTMASGADRDNFIKALRDMGSNAYGVFTSNDKIEYLGTQRTDAYKVYHEMVKEINSSVAKLIFGQDVVSNNTGKVVGSVGENIANMYGDNDAKFIKTLVNSRLIPMMIGLGFSKLNGHKFKWDTTEKLGLIDRATIDAQIARDMGKEHSDEYINKTYGTDVKAKPEPDMTPAIVKNLYAGS